MPLIERVLRRRIDAKLEQLASYSPFPPETARKLAELVTVSMTYHSNAIEGSTMRLLDVDMALGGHTIPGEHTAEEVAETMGHAAAWRRVQEDVEAGNPMRPELIIELHTLVKPYQARLDKYDVSTGVPQFTLEPRRGGWRTQQVYIRGAQHTPPHVSEVPRYMTEWALYANKREPDPIAHAAKAHAGFEVVHPFLDGNGRTGRLLMNWMLLKAAVPPAILLVEERTRYIQSLAAAVPPAPLDYAPISQLLAERVDAALTLYLSALVPDDSYREISLEEAAPYADLSARRLRGLAAEGKLEAKRYGKRWVTWRAALDTYLLTRNAVGKPSGREKA